MTSIKNQMFLFCAVLGFVGLSTSKLVFADYKLRICIGEDQANGCPVAKDAMFGCGTTADHGAENVCTITKNGKKEVLSYRLVHEGSHSGGRCGYEWYLVTCMSK